MNTLIRTADEENPMLYFAKRIRKMYIFQILKFQQSKLLYWVMTD